MPLSAQVPLSELEMFQSVAQPDIDAACCTPTHTPCPRSSAVLPPKPPAARPPSLSSLPCACPPRAIGAEVLIDDNPAYAVECAAAGIPVLLYDWEHAYPWSKTSDGPTHDRITRCEQGKAGWGQAEQSRAGQGDRRKQR